MKPYSLDQRLLRDVAARTTEGLRAAFGQDLAAVCPEDIRGWFGSRGGVTEPVDRPGQKAETILDRLRSPTVCAMHW